MRLEKNTALRLRKSGQSYNEIADALGVPKSTLATWFRDLTLPQALRDRLYDRARSAGTRALVARNKRQTVLAQERARAIQQTARAEIGLLSRRELQLIGAALYWAEGAKRAPVRGGRRVAFSNADPSAVTLMMRFFRQVCRVPEEKFRVQLTVAPGISIHGAVRFWSALTGIPTGRFTKTYSQLSRFSRRKRPRSRLPYGTVQVRIADTQLFYRIMGWIQAMQDGSDHAS
jgi:AcrR family transcriptional regulator